MLSSSDSEAEALQRAFDSFRNEGEGEGLFTYPTRIHLPV